MNSITSLLLKINLLGLIAMLNGCAGAFSPTIAIIQESSHELVVEIEGHDLSGHRNITNVFEQIAISSCGEGRFKKELKETNAYSGGSLPGVGCHSGCGENYPVIVGRIQCTEELEAWSRPANADVLLHLDADAVSFIDSMGQKTATAWSGDQTLGSIIERFGYPNEVIEVSPAAFSMLYRDKGFVIEIERSSTLGSLHTGKYALYRLD